MICACFRIVLSLVYAVLLVCLDCPFLIVHSIFSNVYFHSYIYIYINILTGEKSLAGLNISVCPTYASLLYTGLIKKPTIFYFILFDDLNEYIQILLSY